MKGTTGGPPPNLAIVSVQAGSRLAELAQEGWKLALFDKIIAMRHRGPVKVMDRFKDKGMSQVLHSILCPNEGTQWKA